MSDLKADVEASFRRHMDAAPYAKDLIKRIAFEVVPLIIEATSSHITVAEALKDEFKKIVSEMAGAPFETLGVAIPADTIWQRYASAAIAAQTQPPSTREDRT